MALPPVKGKWSRQQYINAHKFLRPFVNSKFNLSKRLSVGQKSAIRKAYREAVEAGLFSNQLAELKRVPRLPAESKTAHRRRIRQIKASVGQTGRLLNAPVLALPEGSRVSFRNGQITVTRPNRRERYYGINVSEFVSDPISTVLAVIDAAIADGFDQGQFLFGVNRGDTFSLTEPRDLQEFLDLAEELESDYDVEEFLMGLVASVAVDS